MMNILHRPPEAPGNREWRMTEPSDEAIHLEHFMAAARRQIWAVIICALLGLGLGAVYLAKAVPLFTASSFLLIDPLKVSNQVQVIGPADMSVDSSAVDSQVEILKSERVFLAVAEKLNLRNNAQFATDTSSPINNVIGTARSILGYLLNRSAGELAGDEEFQRQRETVDKLKSNLAVSRVGKTYVLQVTYTSPSPDLSAAIANGFAEAYLTELLDAKYDAARRASGWLQDRIAELKRQVLETDLAVQQYRAENNLITADGTLLSEQQLAELNSQLILARAERAQAEAKLERVKSIVANREMEAAVTESLESPVINDLRSKYLDASKRETEISEKLGRDHVQAIRLRNSMKEYERLLFGELERIAQSYESGFQVAKAREESIHRDLGSLQSNAASTNTTQVTLRELEREAETYRNLYKAFLQRYQESVQQQSFPITEARIITSAVKPLKPSHPKKSLVLALMFAVGGAAGVGVGALREFRERGFRTGEQVREELGIEFLGELPIIKPAHHSRRKGGAVDGEIAERSIEPDPAMRYVLEAPLSMFSESLRSAKVAADLALGHEKVKVIGVVSVLPEEGKTTVAKNFASLISHLGHKTLLIDGDIRNPRLTEAIAPKARSGLVEALRKEAPWGDLVLFELDSQLIVLPTVSRRSPQVSHTGLLLSSPAMKELLADAGSMFEYIIVDLPPLGPVVDVKAAVQIIDAFVFVVDWGRTARKLVRTSLENEPAIREKTLGVLLNKVRTSEMRLYADYGSKGHYSSKYGKYYQRG